MRDAQAQGRMKDKRTLREKTCHSEQSEESQPIKDVGDFSTSLEMTGSLGAIGQEDIAQTRVIARSAKRDAAISTEY
ncbi:MAG: hypothetical protein LBL66_02825, partial [Clostridiales bacterium]|nr:hypothetical protein [Clostridiales bacterium]